MVVEEIKPVRKSVDEILADPAKKKEIKGAKKIEQGVRDAIMNDLIRGKGDFKENYLKAVAQMWTCADMKGLKAHTLAMIERAIECVDDLMVKGDPEAFLRDRDLQGLVSQLGLAAKVYTGLVFDEIEGIEPKDSELQRYLQLAGEAPKYFEKI